MKFSELAKVYDQISVAGNDPKRVELLAGVFRRADVKTLRSVAHFTLSELVDPRIADRLGIGPATIRGALADLRRTDAAAIDEEVRRTGDMSEIVAGYAGGKDTLTIDGLWRRVNNAVERNENRLGLVKYVFGHTTAAGAKYFTRMALNQMRIGAGLGTLVRAIAKASNVKAAQVEHLYAMTNDIGLAATRARQGEGALERSGPQLFMPYQFMNAHKIDDPSYIFQTLAGKQIIFEVKYDGARLQIHIRGGRQLDVRLYSRRLNDDTASMPDIAAAIRECWKGGDAIIEGEAVAFDPSLKKKQPFQSVLMRLGRKHEIEEKAREIPLVLYLFELAYDRGESLMDMPQQSRRDRLKELFTPTGLVKLTESMVSDKPASEEKFFKRAIKAGHEGLMAKDPDANYIPGKRTENWMKLKPAFETLDVVVIGGICGSGRRRGLLSSLIIAIRDRNRFKAVGKVGTGFSEEVMRELTARLEPRIVTSRGRNVEIEPEMVIEVDFQDIQKTNRYEAGYALRIPRFKRERIDKSIREADTLARLKRLYQQSHG